MGYGMSYGMDFGYGGGASYVLLILIKVLFVLFILGLVIGVLVFIKNNIFTPHDIKTIKRSFSGNVQDSRKPCNLCGKALDLEWKVCPHCGTHVCLNNTNE